MGLHKDRFSGDVDEDFYCSICQDVIENPTATQCEHVFCEICINEWLQRESSCPVDRKHLTCSQLCEPSRFFRNFYSKLVLKCEFEPKGCKKSFKIEEIVSHQNKCEFNPNFINKCEKGCEAILSIDELQEHNCTDYLKFIILKLKEESNKRESKQEELVRDLQSLLSTQSNEIEELQQKIENQPLPTSHDSCVSIPNYRWLFDERSLKHMNRFALNTNYYHKNNLINYASNQFRELIEMLKTKGVLKTNRVENALLSVDRRLFCYSYPYSDEEKPIGCGTILSAPYTHANIMELLESFLKRDSSVLDIGSGSGYLTLCLAHMIGSNGKVIGIDHSEELINRSKEVLKKHFSHISNKVEFIVSDGRNGYLTKAPYDVINIGGAVDEVPQVIINQLKRGGRIIAPIGLINYTKKLTTIDKLENGLLKKVVRFNTTFGSLKDLQTQLRVIKVQRV